MSSPSVRKGKVNCCVVGCHNSYQNTEKIISFYRFPPDNYISHIRRAKWINAVKRQNEDGGTWHPSKNTRICSQHFIGGQKSEHPDHPAYSPTIFPTNKLTSKVVDSSRFQRLKQRKEHQLLAQEKVTEEKLVQEKLVEVRTSATKILETVLDKSNEELPMICSKEIACQTEDDSEISYTNEALDKTFASSLYFREHIGTVDYATQTTMRKAISSKTTRNQKCGPCGIEVDSTPGRCLVCDCFHGFDSVKNDEQLIDLTGVKKVVFDKLLELLKPRQEKKVMQANRLLIFLMKLKTDLTFSSLGVIFCLHRTTISRIFFDVLANLAEATKDYIYWPSKDTIIKTLPKRFKTHYPQCRVIIDCTEIKLQLPAKISDRIHVYSHYKGTYTAKMLIGITPSGVISFISPIYGGKASDVQITTECGILDKLEKNDVILADKGFPGIKIKDDVLIIMPPFLHDGTLTEEEVTNCFNIASVRIHVERAIGRIKFFHILQNRLPILFFPYLNEIVRVICVLVNFMSPLIKET